MHGDWKGYWRSSSNTCVKENNSVWLVEKKRKEKPESSAFREMKEAPVTSDVMRTSNHVAQGTRGLKPIPSQVWFHEGRTQARGGPILRGTGDRGQPAQTEPEPLWREQKHPSLKIRTVSVGAPWSKSSIRSWSWTKSHLIGPISHKWPLIFSYFAGIYYIKVT